MVQQQQAPPSPAIVIPGFSRGAGATRFRPGFYTIGTNFDGRFEIGMPGPREVVDLTGIAAGYRVIKMLKASGPTAGVDIDYVIATNGTLTKVYRKETTWVSKIQNLDGAGTAGQITGVATDAVYFNGILAVALGSAAAYVFCTPGTTANGADNIAWTTSTKTASTAKNANYFLIQVNGLVTPRCTYARNPNEIYFTTDLSNTDATGSVANTISDNQAASQYITSLDQDDTGRLLIGMRHALYSLDGDVTEKLTHDYPDPPADASAASTTIGAYNSQDRMNFEGPVHVEGRVYYPIRGYDILEFYHGHISEYMAPRWVNPTIPRISLPINAMCAAGGWLIVALGSKNTGSATIGKSVTYAPGGNAHLGNLFTVVSELWAGRYQQDDKGDIVFVWHGILLVCTSALRYMWFDESDSYLYLASGDSESADLQMRRCLFYTENPLYKLTASAIVLNAGTWAVELQSLEWDSPFSAKEMDHINLDVLGLASTVPSLQVSYKVTPDYDTNALTSLVTYTDSKLALLGDDFPSSDVFRKMCVRFTGVGTGNSYAILRMAEVRANPTPIYKRERAVR